MTRWWRCVLVASVLLLSLDLFHRTRPVFATSSYASVVLGDGPVSYWRLGETSGKTAADSGTGGNPGTINGGTTLGVPGAIVGDSNTAVSFNGSTGYVGVKDKANLDITGDLTVELWAKPAVLNGTTMTILHKGDISSSNTGGWQYGISLNSTKQWKGNIYVGSTTYSVLDATDTPSTSRWDCLVLVRSGNTLIFYVNGQSVDNTTVSGATNTGTGMLAIGRRGSNASSYYKGSVDEVAIYNKALSATQIQNHYNVGIAPNPTSTPTNTPVPPTNTPVPPTSTPVPTNTAVPTDTPTPTSTPVPSTSTPVPPTNTPVPPPTSTSTPTATPIPTPTPTNTPIPATNTPVPTPTPTATSTPTSTSTPLSYSSTILGDGPVSYWRLGETSGMTAADSGTGGNPGTINGGTTLGVPGAIVGDPDTAMSFDGVSGYIGVPDNPNLDITGDLTVELWAKPAVLNGTTMTILHKGDISSSNTGGWQYGISLNSTKQWKGNIYVGSTTYSVLDATDTPSTSRWDYLVLVRSGNTLTFYVNGQSVGNTTVSGATNTGTGMLAIGRRGSYAGYYDDGSVDEVAIYNKALSATQIQNHYAAAAGSSATPTPTASPMPSTSPTPTPTASPTPSSSDPVVMAAGDIACDPTSATFNGGNGTSSGCQELYTSNELSSSLSAVLPLGDDQYECGTLTQFQQSYDPAWGRLKAITHPAPGNHEYGNTTACSSLSTASGYYTYYGSAASPLDSNCTASCKGYYSYNVGTWHIIVLNSECVGSYTDGCPAGTTPSTQEQWLQSDLAANSSLCTLAYWHRPLFSSGFTTGDNAMLPWWQDLYNANVDVVLNGHDHDYERFAPQDPYGNADLSRGIREFIVGTGGRDLTGFTGVAANSQVRDNTTFGVLKLTLHPSSYDWQFLPDGQSGSFTDSGTGTCH